jgi:hypothetical protein
MTQTPFFAQGQSSAPCWFVGAMINRGDDQTDRFIDEGIWEHDFDDNSRVLAQVRSMQAGERIAIKAATRRKAGLIDSTDKTRRACYS